MLNNGKIPENILKRSVLKNIKHTRKEVIQGPMPGGDFAAVNIDSDKILITSVEPMVAHNSIDVPHLLTKCANNILASGGDFFGIMVSIMLPEGSEEELIKSIMETLNEAASNMNVQIMGGHTEVSASVNEPVITITGLGLVDRINYIGQGKATAGDDIVVTKWIGLEGTSVIARSRQEELKRRFSPAFVDEAVSFDQFLSVAEDVSAIKECEISSMHDVSTGGIFGGLWELGQASQVGLEVDLMSIPVRQETIEICEEYGVNPYELVSGGALLVTSPDGMGVVRALKAAGINGTIIGKVTKSNDRVLINGDEKRFLVPVRNEEIYKIDLRGKESK